MTEAWKQWEGQTVNGKFPLLQYLGGSDHSAVFLTDFGQEHQRAAIKLIPTNPDDAALQLSQLELAAKLSHPHLIRLFQTGQCQLADTCLLYIVMEYAQENLSQILPHRPLTPAESKDMLAPVLDVLADIHSKGFVHGHIKPANILAVDDQLKLSSDGLSRIGESRGGPATPSVYGPPEATSAGMSPAGDVWSLGVTLVESLTQRLPVWEATTAHEEPLVPETLPAPFLDIARHCLRQDPRQRLTVANIKARLIPASPVPHERTLRPPRSPAGWRYTVPIASGVVVLLAMLVGLRLIRNRPELPQTPPSAFERPDSKTTTGGLVQGVVINQVVPDVPAKAKDTIQGTIKVVVRVNVDPSGSVTGAVFDSPGPSKYFANLALQAARRWKFSPAKIDGRNVSSEWILRFQFERTGTKVLPARVAR